MARQAWPGAVLAALLCGACGARAESTDAGPDAAHGRDCCVASDPDAGDAADPGDDAGRDAEPDAPLPPPPEPWTVPDCEIVTGTASLTLSFDRGTTLLPRDAVPEDEFAYTDGLAALEEDGWLLAVSDDRLSVSQDAGCSWTELRIIGDLARVASGPGRLGVVFGRQILLRVEGEDVTDLVPPAEELVGLAVDPTDPDHLRAADDGCGLWESIDGGESWEVLAPVPGDVRSYAAAFDPVRLDVAVCATSFDGALRWEGGSGWATASGVGEGGDATLFQVAFSRVDPSIVWLYGNHDVVAELVRGLWISRDGGLTFTEAVDDTRIAGLTNDSFLAPDPFEDEVVWFRARDSVCRYDAGAAELDQRDNGRENVQAVVRLPTEEEVLAVGLRIEGPIQ